MIIALLVCSEGFAQSDVPGSYPVNYITQFQDVFVDANGLGYVVGKCGVLRKTENDGQKWETVSSPTGNDIYSVACAPGDCSKVLLTTNDQMYRLENGTWTDVTYPDFNQAGQIHWLTDMIVVHESTSNSYHRSTDGGITWSEVPYITFQQSNMAIVNNQNGYVFIDDKLYGTTDMWETIDSLGYNHPVDVRRIAWLDMDKGWLFDADRLFYGTTDGGKTWDLLNGESQLTSVNWFVALSETHLVGAQVTTSRLESTDGGVTWNRDSFLENGNKRVNEKYHQKGDAFFLVGNQSQMLYSSSDFTGFVELDPYDRQNRLGPIAFNSDDVGYVLAGIEVKVTIDGGQSWSNATLPEVGRDLDVLNDGSLVVLANGRSVRSSDLGATFTEWLPDALTPSNEDPTRFGRKPNGHIYLMSSNYGYLSTDGGETFSAIQTDHGFTVSGLFFLDSDNGYAVGGQSQYAFTTDGGQSWTIGEGPANNLVNIYYTDADNGMATTARNRYVTNDRGQTWTSAGSTGGYDFTVNPVDGSILAARFGSGNTGELVRSDDMGATWSIIGFNCFSYRAAAITPSGRYFYTSGDGFIVRHDLDAISVGTISETKTKTKTLQIYPNPATDMISIEIPNENVQSVVQVFHSGGHQVDEVNIQPGLNRVELSMTNYPTGIYFIQWIANNEVGQARVVKN